VGGEADDPSAPNLHFQDGGLGRQERPTKAAYPDAFQNRSENRSAVGQWANRSKKKPRKFLSCKALQVGGPRLELGTSTV